MSFIKRDVKDRVVQYPRRYQLVEVQPGIFDLIPVTGTVTEEGTPINKAYLQPIEDGLENALEKTGDGKDVTVTFSEADTEAHIASGEKLSTMFGKILKKFKNVAPKSHASTGTDYGLGTTTNYGHVKTINNLTQASHVNGNALSAYQGTIIKRAIYKRDYSGGVQYKDDYIARDTSVVSTTHPQGIDNFNLHRSITVNVPTTARFILLGVNFFSISSTSYSYRLRVYKGGELVYSPSTAHSSAGYKTLQLDTDIIGFGSMTLSLYIGVNFADRKFDSDLIQVFENDLEI